MGSPNSQASVVAVIDRVGRVSRALRAACPAVAFRTVKNRAGLGDSDEPMLIVAVYSLSDWDAVNALAQIRTTVVISARRRDDSVRAVSLNAFGYLYLGLGQGALRRAILGALRGEPAYSRATLGRHLRAKLEATVLRASRLRDLTPRQREVVALIASGASDKEIAGTLGIAPATAQKHVTNLLRRLDVPNRAAAAVTALSSGEILHVPGRREQSRRGKIIELTRAASLGTVWTAVAAASLVEGD